MQCLAEREGKTRTKPWSFTGGGERLKATDHWLVTHWEVNLCFLFFLRSKIGALVRELAYHQCGLGSSPVIGRFLPPSPILEGFPRLPQQKLLPLLLFFSLPYLIRATLRYLNNLCTDPLPLRKNRPLFDFSWGEGSGGVCKEVVKKGNISNSKSIRNGNERITSYVDVLALHRYLFIHLYVIYFENRRNYLEVYNSPVACTKTWDSSWFLRN